MSRCCEIVVPGCALMFRVHCALHDSACVVFHVQLTIACLWWCPSGEALVCGRSCLRQTQVAPLSHQHAVGMSSIKRHRRYPSGHHFIAAAAVAAMRALT